MYIVQILSTILRIILLNSFLLFGIISYAQGPDLPSPSTTTETIPLGSYVIAMDNANQSLIAPFNLKAYGLANALLQAGIPVKWAITAGKAIDDIDFTATAFRKYPSVLGAAPYDFKAGPFIIDSSYTDTADVVILAFGSSVAVYELVGNEVIDIRYTITHKPKIAVLDNGANAVIHTKILDLALIPEYDVILAEQLDDSGFCYTFVSEPHWNSTDTADTAITYNVRDFVYQGGNFLAQCEGVGTYSRFDTFHTDKGILNAGVKKSIGQSYVNADLAYLQFNGAMKEGLAGSLRNWWRDTTTSSQFRSYHYPSVMRASDSLIIASGAKIINPELPGGNVFYLGGHDYYHTTDITKMNALRVYLNAALIPAYAPTDCELAVGANTITGTVFEDVDVDSTFSLGDTGLISIEVRLYIDVNGNGVVDAGEPLFETTTTDANGFYSFTVGMLGNFAIDIKVSDLPAGYSMTTDNIEVSSFTDINQIDSNNDFGAWFGLLPVELISFTANVSGSAIEISWATATELNNDFFTVERSADGINFEGITTVPGAGTTSIQQNYSIFDFNPFSGQSYYRLKQTDFNGDAVHFSIVSVNLNSVSSGSFEVFPNPTTSNVINVRFKSKTDGEFNVSIYDLSGQLVLQKTMIGYANTESLYELDADGKLSTGLYLVIGTTEDQVFRQKMVITNK